MRDWDKPYRDKIAIAVSEAERFIRAGKAAIADIESEDYCSHHSPAVAAAKRASMDLTRSLVGVRESRYK